MDEIIKEISKEFNVEEIDTNDEVFFSDNSYESVPFSYDNFHHGRKLNSGVRLTFIDGGNCQIISSSNISVNFIRIHASSYKHFTKDFAHTTEFFSMTKFERDTNTRKVNYMTKIYPYRGKIGLPDEKTISFSIEDETLKQGVFNASVSKIVDVVRRFAEIKLASELIDTKLESGDMIVLDGTLQQSYTNEEKYFDELFNKAMKKNILISALAKTSTLITKKGNSIISVLNKMSKDRDDRWYYHPIVKINKKEHPAEMYFVKLYPSSKFIFRFEVYKKQNFVDIDKVIGYLCLTSQDPAFFGYPYGLVDVDAFARVSEDEAKYLRLRFKSLSRDVEIKDSENKAHNVLDTMKF
jgi:hypothetical protein